MNNILKLLPFLERGDKNSQTCEKIFHGPAGQIEGLQTIVIDRLGSLIFVIIFSPIEDNDLCSLVKLIQEQFPLHAIRIQSRAVSPAVDLYLSESFPESLIIEEEGLSFQINPLRGQNIGFFPDMIEGHKTVFSYISEKSKTHKNVKVLNLFSYTCAFSVFALKAGAKDVHNWDMNRNSLTIGRENHRLNKLPLKEDNFIQGLKFFAYDIFKSFGKIKKNGPYDLVIIDPPPFQGKHFHHIRDYPKLIKRLSNWLNEGGAGLFCLNAPNKSFAEFFSMIQEGSEGQFSQLKEIKPPLAYQGRFEERGLKIILGLNWQKNI